MLPVSPETMMAIDGLFNSPYNDFDGVDFDLVSDDFFAGSPVPSAAGDTFEDAQNINDIADVLGGLIDSENDESDFVGPEDSLLLEPSAVAKDLDVFDLNPAELFEKLQPIPTAELPALSEEAEVDDEDEVIPENSFEVPIGSNSVHVVGAAPQWICGVPLDPRCSVRFQPTSIDSRVPFILPPRIDQPMKVACHCTTLSPLAYSFQSALQSSDVSSLDSEGDSIEVVDMEVDVAPAEAVTVTKPSYVHDDKTCWICKSSNSKHRKKALHRYVEKRSRRNWKKGARYAARSNVATSRVRQGGRFVTKCRWVSAA